MRSGPRTLLVLIMGVVLFVSACQAGPAPRSDGATASPASVSPNTASQPASPTSPLDDPGQPTQAPAGKVSVTLDAARFTSRAAIVVVVANGLVRPVFTDDSKTDCSIISLQRRDTTTWTDVLNCSQQRPPATSAIGPQHARTVTLKPTAESQGAIGPGTYRAKFTYRFDADQSGNDPLTAVSDPFQIS